MWLSQAQMVELFKSSKANISEHIKKILCAELNADSVVRKLRTTAPDGKEYMQKFYNLDMIISVGYRVNSQRGIAFRKWANRILKEYLLRGYVINQPRLDYLEKTIKVKVKFK